MTFIDMLGWFAASLVLATFCARQMVPLRLLASVSNLAFIGYAALGHLWPILILHATLLPINLIRLRHALIARDAPRRLADQAEDRIGANPVTTGAAAEFRAVLQLAAAHRQFAKGGDHVRRHALAR
jgi:hypothetical protein